MTVIHKPFIIFEIEEIQKAEINARGRTLFKKPELDMYKIKAILKEWVEKTKDGRKLLKQLGHEEHMEDLDLSYLKLQESFIATIPVTHQTLNWNKYQVGSEIMIAYYPTNVWATFHTDGEPDNINDKRRI